MFHFESLKLSCCDGKEVGAPGHLGRCYLPSVFPNSHSVYMTQRKGFASCRAEDLGQDFLTREENSYTFILILHLAKNVFLTFS